MKASDNFTVKELVDPETVNILGDRAINAIHPFRLITLEQLRKFVIEKTGDGITINDYEWGGQFQYSGTRPFTYKKGAKFSTHRYMNTDDCKFKGITPIEVQQHIMDNQDLYPYIVRMENAEITKTWLHIENGYRNGSIIIFNP